MRTVRRASIREERTRVLEFLATLDLALHRQAEFEAEMDRLLARQRSVYLQDRDAPRGAGAGAAGGVDAAHAGPKSAELEAVMAGAEHSSGSQTGETPPAAHTAGHAADPCCATPAAQPGGRNQGSRSQSPMRSPMFSLRRPAAGGGFSFNAPDEVFADKVEARDGGAAPTPRREPEPKSWAGGVRATLFFSPFMRRAGTGQTPPPKTGGGAESVASPQGVRPDGNGGEGMAPQDESAARRPGVFERMARVRSRVGQALASYQKGAAARACKLRGDPAVVRAAIKDQVDKITATYERDGTEAVCVVAGSIRWTIAHYAAHYGAQRTLEFVASVAPRLFLAADRGGNTPAHVAAARGNQAALRLLHRHMRAAFAVHNAAGKSPGDCADKRVRALVAALETNHGGPITAQVLITGRSLLRKTGIQLK